MSFWTGFMFGFPTILSYIVVALSLRYPRVLASHAEAQTFGDLSVAAAVISQFIGTLRVTKLW